MNRRRALAAGLSAAAIYSVAGRACAEPQPGTSNIARFEQTAPFPVNAYIVEGADGIAVIDATLTHSSSLALRAKVDAMGKPLKGVLLTHAHPDHYAGLGNLTSGLDVPIVSVEGVREIAKRDDATKDAIIGGMFGAEWPSNRVFPNEIVRDGGNVSFGAGLDFEVRDIGPAESFHDSMFVLKGEQQRVFAGDLAYGLMHPYMADNTNPEWRAALDGIRLELAEDAVLYVGHGAPVTPGFLAWQKDYLSVFERVLADQDWTDRDAAVSNVSQTMRAYLPNDDLSFLMELSVLPNAERLGLI
ncbi:MAG: MBL fold metallo-hydrolase [Pseudomonadota bacterium]